MTSRTHESQKRPYAHYERLTSAGGVVYRLEDGEMQVLLCGRTEPPLWSLPKGTPDEGESIRATALREVREETGVQTRIVGKLGSIRYMFTRIQDNTRCDKTVHHYLMEPVGGDPSQHDHEFEEVRWFPVEEALKIMTYPNEITMVRKAIDAVAGRTKLRRLRAETEAPPAARDEGARHA